MIHSALNRSIPVELTADRRIARRVKRLAATSAVALGSIWMLAATTLQAPLPVHAALVSGWIMMPTVLVASLWRPSVRYWLVVPSTLISLGLMAVSVGWLPEEPMAAAGWRLITAGVLLGGVMGAWFWFRVVPVPSRLDDPTSAGRWALIAVHVALITAGLLLVIAADRSNTGLSSHQKAAGQPRPAAEGRPSGRAQSIGLAEAFTRSPRNEMSSKALPDARTVVLGDVVIVQRQQRRSDR